MDIDEVVLWGTGVRGEEAYRLFRMLGIKITAAVDSNPSKTNRTWHNISVISPENYFSQNIGNDKFLIITPDKCGPIVYELNKKKRYNYILFLELINRETFLEQGCILHREDSKFLVEKYILINRVLKIKIDEYRNALHDLLYKSCANGNTVGIFKIKDWLKRSKYCVIPIRYGAGWGEIFSVIFGKKLVFSKDGVLPDNAELFIKNGLNIDSEIEMLFIQAIKRDISILWTEDGFICSVLPYGTEVVTSAFGKRHSIVFDEGGLYINANVSSALENLLNSGWQLSYSEKNRADWLIKTICEKKLSKYNHQPIITPIIGEMGRQKVLVVDQVYRDQSIAFGMATENTFNEMLQAAIEENTDADIIIKTHPGANVGHYGDVESEGNIYKIDYGINPICLLEYVDKVYVCTSQMGFEALMCGKEVHVFGMPFYAGWGVTHDRLICPRRTKKRSVEEIFYMAYIEYSHYVSYKTNSECEIEQAIDEILELRDEYWKEQGIK